jgi:hypothetical protein
MKKFLKHILSFSVVLSLLTGCNTDEVPAALPSEVSLISPLENQTCEEGINSEEDRSRIFFEWEPALNAQSYDLVVKDLETGVNFITYEEIYDTKKELELVHNRAYSWYVISKHSGSDETGVSPTWNFFFVGEPKENYAPFPASIIYPEFGESVDSSDGTVDLKWEASDPDGDNLMYTVYLDEVDGMQEPSENLSNFEDTDLSIQLETGKTYFWRVKSTDGSSSSYSQIYKFTVN